MFLITDVESGKVLKRIDENQMNADLKVAKWTGTHGYEYVDEKISEDGKDIVRLVRKVK